MRLPIHVARVTVRASVRLALVTLVGAACAGPPARARDSTSASPPPAERDTAHIARLEREARALVSATGCDAAAGCRTAPVGWRGCGGPRTYVVYCAATTDSAALFAKLAELARAEEAFNRASGMASTCEFRMPPNVSVQGGRCVAAPSDEIPVQ